MYSIDLIAKDVMGYYAPATDIPPRFHLQYQPKSDALDIELQPGTAKITIERFSNFYANLDARYRIAAKLGIHKRWIDCIFPTAAKLLRNAENNRRDDLARKYGFSNARSLGKTRLEQIQNLLGIGVTRPEIADVLGITENAIGYHMRKAGIWEPRGYRFGVKAARNYTGLLPHGLDEEQTAWERRQRVLRAVEAGATQAQIGKYLGVTAQTVSTIVAKAKRDENRKPPINCYFDEIGELNALRRLLRVLKAE